MAWLTPPERLTDDANRIVEPEHLLLALAADGNGRVSAILPEVGIDGVVALVDGMPGERRPPVSAERLKQWLLRVAMRSAAPQPGPLPPVFERYTAEAQQAMRGASETASLLEHHYVQPLHVLLGCLHVPDSWRPEFSTPSWR